MKLRLPVRGVFAACLVLFLCYLVSPLFAAEKETPTADQPHEIEIETLKGETIKGTIWIDKSLRIKTEYGYQEVYAEHIKRVSFRTLETQGSVDTVELTDKNHIRGELLTDSIRVQSGKDEKSYPTKELKEIHNTKVKKPFSLAASLIALLTLSLMEIVLGIDNIIFLAIIAGKLPPEQQPKARRYGLFAALGTRLLLLCFLTVLLGLTKPIFTLPEWGILSDLEAREISLRDLILLLGGMFLIGKSTLEIHHKMEDKEEHGGSSSGTASFGKVLIQIAIVDIVFSLDSVITAVGMVDELWVMITGMVIAMGVMLAFAGTISDFVAKHPTLKILALSFLILIGVMLVAEGLGQHIDKGYIYFAMAFGVGVEMINLQINKKSTTAEATPASG
jgi:predicted tellurium resistance membrane protein TerC